MLVKEKYYGTFHEFDYQVNSDDTLEISCIPENISFYYPSNYHCHIVEKGNRSIRSYLSILKRKISVSGKFNFLCNLNFIKSTSIYRAIGLLKLKANAKIIDVGCGGGSHLYSLKEIGFNNLFGLDPFLPNELLERKDVKFIKGNFDDLDEKYNLIIFNHSLEHMSEHQKVLTKAKTLLVPDGYIIIRIPLFHSLAWNMYHEIWYQLDAPRHLKLYSKDALVNLFERYKFRCEKIIFDSEFIQFARSEMYKMDIPISAFWDKYKGNYLNLFDKSQLKGWKKLTEKVNAEASGDQATFIFKNIV